METHRLRNFEIQNYYQNQPEHNVDKKESAGNHRIAPNINADN